MRQYVWINPVIEAMAGVRYPEILKKISKQGFAIVSCTTGLGRVRDEYKSVLAKQRSRPLIDTRCPVIREVVSERYPELSELLADIPPILMACAQDIYEEYIKKSKVPACLTMVTPCSALAKYGNENFGSVAYFTTWTEFCKKNHIQIQLERAGISPIPPGFFRFSEYKICETSGEVPVNDMLEQVVQKQLDAELLELLYCHDGCINGDGVLT